MNEPQEQIRSAPQASKTALQLFAQLCIVCRRCIGQTGIEILVAILLLAEFGRVLGRGLSDDFRMVPPVAHNGSAIDFQ